MAPKSSPAHLDEARHFFQQRAWRRSCEAFAAANESEPLRVSDLESFASAAALAGDDVRYFALMEQVYQLHVDKDDCPRAARAAFWLGFRLMGNGEYGRGGAWLSRSQRQVDAFPETIVERAYLLLPTVMRQIIAGHFEGARVQAQQAIALGEQFRDRDVIAMGQNLLGRALLRGGQREEGLALLDESMLAVANGELNPILTGVLYCGVIASCQRMFEFERAREWTLALQSWCDAQPELVSFRGRCQVHRAEILQLGGSWSVALAQAEHAINGDEREACADGWYQKADIHRLRGEFDLAEDALRSCSQLGREPQPALALLRVATGQPEAAMSALRRVLTETGDALTRGKYLPAMVDVALLQGALEEAQNAAAELEQSAERVGTDGLEAYAAHARGRVLLFLDDAQAALGPLRRACYVWQQMNAPYLDACVRVDLARACSKLGDEEGASLLREAARRAFHSLGAAPDLKALGDAFSNRVAAHGLTPREAEVLKLLATGKTNKEIANTLGLSEKTVDRHVSNLFEKLGVNTRAAATAKAYEERLL